VDVVVQSGEILRVYFSRDNNRFEEIFLEGRVKMVYQGFLLGEAYT
jgi:diaminopimelate epimerase